MKVLTPLLRHRRSRLLPAFGQISPSKRPFGALGLTELTSRGTWQSSSHRGVWPGNTTVIRTLSWPPMDLLLPRPSSGDTPFHAACWSGLQGVATWFLPFFRPPWLWLFSDDLSFVAQPALWTASTTRTADITRRLNQSRPSRREILAPRQALSGWSGRGHSREADERRDADSDRADDGEDRLPGG